MTTAEEIRESLIADITAAASTSERSQQVATGASQIFGCVAAGIFRLRGEPGAHRVSWASEVGSAIHGRLAEQRARVHPGAIVERRFVYLGVPATVDYIDPETRTLVDYKTKDDAAAVRAVTEPTREQLAQLHLGAAAAREAGIPVDWVALVFLPRAGDLEDAKVLGPWAYDEEQAIAAASWSADLDALAALADDPREHRDKPAFWCRAYCGFHAACRGEDAEFTEEDFTALEPIAAAYMEAGEEEKAAVARRQELRPQLLGLTGRAGAYKVLTSSPRPKVVTEPDIDELAAWWEASQPGVPLPVLVSERTASPSLRVTRVKP